MTILRHIAVIVDIGFTMLLLWVRLASTHRRSTAALMDFVVGLMILNAFLLTALT